MSDKIKRGIKGMLEFPCDVERLDNGNTLITDAGDETSRGSEVIEVDIRGQIVWQYGEDLNFAHSAKRLDNGNTLISDTNNNRVIEISPEGNIVFNSNSWGNGSGKLSDGSHLHYPNDVHQLENENLLITDRNNDRCLIVDKKGRIEWYYDQKIQHPHNCDITSNGNILIADSDGDKIIEVSREKKIVREYGNDELEEDLDWPRDVDVLPNGNLLITDSKNSRIIEINENSDKVWEYKVDYFANFYEADKLKNENILISDQQHHRVFEIDEYGNIIWEFKNYKNPNYIHKKLKNGSLKTKNQDGFPAHWNLYNRLAEGGGKLVWEEDDQGRSCPVLNYDREGVLFLYQVLAVESGKRYRMAGKLKTENMKDGSFAYLQMAYLDSEGGLVEEAAEAPKGKMVTEDQDWQEDSFQAVAPEEASSVELRIVICGEGRVKAKNIMFFG